MDETDTPVSVPFLEGLEIGMAEMTMPGFKGRGAMKGEGVFNGCRMKGKAVEAFCGEVWSPSNKSPSGFISYPTGRRIEVVE
jgi:hypothetical protein